MSSAAARWQSLTQLWAKANTFQIRPKPFGSGRHSPDPKGLSLLFVRPLGSGKK
jgi:hypothetical protein